MTTRRILASLTIACLAVVTTSVSNDAATPAAGTAGHHDDHDHHHHGLPAPRSDFDPRPDASLNAVAANLTPSYPTSETFTLHSRPSSTKKIYLDFTGHQLSGTAWNDGYTGGAGVTLARFDMDGNPSAVNTVEHATIQRVWQRVREDFAPFDVDVTTQDPGVEALRKANASDTAFGTRVVITPTEFMNCDCGGRAYIGSFQWSVDTPAFVFTGSSNSDKFIGEASSHEVGHTLGLSHDGTPTDGYYLGQGSWAPIMGVGYYRPVTQWSKGQYTGASNTEDDLAVMAANGVSRVADDVAGDTSTTAVLQAGTRRYGVVGAPGEVDAYRFNLTIPRRLTISTWNNVGPVDPNLNMRLVLRNGAGATLATSSPSPSMGTSMTVSLAPGTYYAYVDGVGEGSSTSTGYSNYGSLGHYGIVLDWA